MLFLTTSRLIIIIGTSSNAYFNYLAFESQFNFHLYGNFLLGQLGYKNIKSLIFTLEVNVIWNLILYFISTNRHKFTNQIYNKLAVATLKC